MGLRDSKKGDRPIRFIINIALCSVVCVLLAFGACKRSTESRIQIELRDIPEAKTQRTPVLDCPPGDPFGNDASAHQGGGHTVSLSWNPSTSSNNPKGRQISYCLYRTKGGPVRPSGNGTLSASPCINCQRVTTKSLPRTDYKDTNVDNGVHYCYVAIAIEAGNVKTSSFSNQADAVIPPKNESPFCNTQGGMSTARAKRAAKNR